MRSRHAWHPEIFGRGIRLICVVGLCFLFPLVSRTQEKISKPPVESEIGIVAGQSFGNLHVVAYASDRRLTLFGVQYARHSWGGFLGARVDYLAEVLPVVLLHEPKVYDYDSIALTSEKKIVYGAEISPIGIRLLWRRHERWKPYLMADGGILYFADKVLSSGGTHLNFSGNFGTGLQVSISKRTELRVGYSYYHLSNGDTAEKNPGLDSNLISATLYLKLHQ